MSDVGPGDVLEMDFESGVHSTIPGEYLCSPSSPVFVPDPPDVTVPQVTNVIPPAASDLGPTDEIGFDVTDDTGIVGLFVYVVYPDLGDWEVVHDGAQFSTRFVGMSTRTSILGGFRFTLKRSGGWKMAPGVARPNVAVRIRAIDAAGNEST